MTRPTFPVPALLAVLALAIATPAAAQANVAGTWIVTIDAPEATGDITAVFTQDGSTVEGAFDLPMVGGSEMADGKVEGSTFTFLLYIDYGDERFTIGVEAEVDGNQMAGALLVPELGSIAFSGQREEG